MARQIFRRVNPDTNVQDIYAIEGDSARYLNNTEFTQNYASPTNAQGVKNEAVEDLGVSDDLYNQYFPQQDNLTGGGDATGGVNVEPQIQNPTIEDKIISSADKAKTIMEDEEKRRQALIDDGASADANGESLFDKQQKQLDDWLKAQTERITAEGDAKIAKREGEQVGEVSSANTFFLGAGAAGRDLSSRGALLKQATTHAEEIKALESEKQRFLNEAQYAYQIGDTNLAIAKQNRADALKAQQEEKYEDLFNFRMQAIEMDRADIEWQQEQEAYQRENAIKEFDLIAMSGKDLNEEQIQTLAQSMGMTIPQFNAYYDNYKASKEAKAQTEALELKKLMKDANTVDWKTFSVDEGNQSVTYVYDPTDREGTMRKIATAPRWKATSGGGGSNSNVGGISGDSIETIKANLLAEVGEDGFLNPIDYGNEKKDWIAQGGTPYSFDDEFEERRDPTNPNYDITQKGAGYSQALLEELYYGATKQITNDKGKKVTVFDPSGLAVSIDEKKAVIQAMIDAGMFTEDDKEELSSNGFFEKSDLGKFIKSKQ